MCLKNKAHEVYFNDSKCAYFVLWKRVSHILEGKGSSMENINANNLCMCISVKLAGLPSEIFGWSYSHSLILSKEKKRILLAAIGRTVTRSIWVLTREEFSTRLTLLVHWAPISPSQWSLNGSGGCHRVTASIKENVSKKWTSLQYVYISNEMYVVTEQKELWILC